MSRDPAFRALELLRVGRAAEAADIARIALTETPDDELSRRVLVAALIELDRADDAVEIAEVGCRLRPSSGQINAARALALRHANRPLEAVEAAETAIRLDPDQPDHAIEYAKSLLAASRWTPRPAELKRSLLTRATQTADAAIATSPTSPDAHVVRGAVALEGGDFATAERSAMKALHLDPELPSAHQLAGLAKAKRRQLLDASDHFVHAGRLDTRSSTSIEMLDEVSSSPGWWGVAIMGAAIPVLSALDGSFNTWMLVPAAGGVAGMLWLRFAPTRRLSAEAKAAKRRARRL
mgnify:CR=1 FL=1